MSTTSTTKNITNYTVGFVLSVVLTLTAYVCVTQGILSGAALTLAIVGLAVVQLLVQLVFFLHLGQEKGTRWNLLTFGFAVLIIGIVVIGTLWIMDNLDTNMMPHDEMQKYMSTHEGI